MEIGSYNDSSTNGENRPYVYQYLVFGNWYAIGKDAMLEKEGGDWGIRLFAFVVVSAMYLLHPAGYVYMVGRPLMVFIGMWLLSSIQVPDCLLYHVLREFSLVLYVCHMLFQFIWTECTHNPSAGGWTPYWFAICGCVLVTAVRITKKNEWKRSREFAKSHSLNVRI